MDPSVGQVILLGATSQIGRFALPRLLAAGYRVDAVSRGPKPEGYPDLAGARWLRPEEVAGYCSEARALVSAGPLALAAVFVGELNKLTTVIAFSTSSIFNKRDSADEEERSELAQISGEESALAENCHERDIRLCLLRPTLVYGCGLDRNVSALARWVQRLPVVPVAGRASGLRQPVHADDLAQAAVAALGHVGDLPGDLALGGGSTLAYREMIVRIGEGLGRKVRLLPLPTALLAALVGLAGRVTGQGWATPSMVRRQHLDLVVDHGEAGRLLGYRPRPFRPAADDFSLPGPGLLRRLAGEGSGREA